MPGFYDALKGEPEDSYGVPSDAYIKYQMDNMDRVEHTNEDQMDENKRVELEELVAERLLEYADTQELERVYFDLQHEWAMSLPDAELLETAERLNIEI